MIENKSEVRKAFEELLEKYGPQKWWPAESEFEVVVGALLTQNTNWKNVERAIENLKKEGVLVETEIVKMKKSRLEALIKPAGFYRQKAERLKTLTKKWLEIDKTKPTEKLRAELLSLKGVGKETADSILLYALERPIFVVDAYTKRFVKSRFNREFKDYEEYREFFESNLPKDVEIYKEYHALIVKWGKEQRKGKRK